MLTVRDLEVRYGRIVGTKRLSFNLGRGQTQLSLVATVLARVVYSKQSSASRRTTLGPSPTWVRISRR